MDSRQSSRIKAREITAKKKKQALDCAIHCCRQKCDRAGFKVQFINNYIGKGVFARNAFSEGDFILEYCGDLISYKEARRREKTYNEDPSCGSFMYFFKHKGRTLCVDATNELCAQGKFVNDSPQGQFATNTTMKIVMVDNKPRLCLFALRDIQVSEEIRYDYGIKDLPWRLDSSNAQTDCDVSRANKTEKGDYLQTKKTALDVGQCIEHEFDTNGTKGSEHVQKRDVNDLDMNGTPGTEQVQVKEVNYLDTNGTTGTEQVQEKDVNYLDTNGTPGSEQVQEEDVNYLDTNVKNDDNHLHTNGTAGSEQVHKKNANYLDENGTPGSEQVQGGDVNYLDTNVKNDVNYLHTNGTTGSEQVQEKDVNDLDMNDTPGTEQVQEMDVNYLDTNGTTGTEQVQEKGVNYHDTNSKNVVNDLDKNGASGTEQIKEKDVNCLNTNDIPGSEQVHEKDVNYHDTNGTPGTEQVQEMDVNYLDTNGTTGTEQVQEKGVNYHDTNSKNAVNDLDKNGASGTEQIKEKDVNCLNTNDIPGSEQVHEKDVNYHDTNGTPGTEQVQEKDVNYLDTNVENDVNYLHMNGTLGSEQVQEKDVNCLDMNGKNDVNDHDKNGFSGTEQVQEKDVSDLDKNSIPRTDQVQEKDVIDLDKNGTPGRKQVQEKDVNYLDTNDTPGTEPVQQNGEHEETFKFREGAQRRRNDVEKGLEWPCAIQETFSEMDIELEESSGSEYLPEADDSDRADDTNGSGESSGDMSDVIIQVVPDISIHLVKNDENKQLEIKKTESSMNQWKGDQGKISVPKSLSDRDGSLRYTKKFYCLYCEKLQSKLLRHLQSKHPTEEEVVEYKNANKEQKALILEKVRNLGNHLHNCQVLRKGEGELAVRYRPGSDHVPPDEYGPCPYCYGYFPLTELWRHKCHFKPEKEGHMKFTATSKLLLPSLATSSIHLRSIVAGMRSDKISRVLKSDQTILDFGEKICCRHGQDIDQHNYVRQKLREMGHLLCELRQLDNSPNKNLKQFIEPSFFRIVVEASKSIASFDPQTNRYSTPSLALKIGHSLQKVAKVLIGQAIERGDKISQEKAEAFLKLVELNWTDEVSSNALKSLYEGKKNSQTRLLPLADDVKVLTMYLKEAGEKHYTQLLATPEENTEELKVHWYELCKIVLTRTILFNRRRVGGVSKMTVAEYQKIKLPETDGCIGTSLNQTEQKLCSTYQRVEISSKRGRTVPVIFSPEVRRHLDALLRKRQLVVDDRNKFLLPRIHLRSLSHLRGSDCIRNYGILSGAKEPSLLRSNNLRKQIATVSQILNLKDNEMDTLATFLGHDIRVHREFYRLPDSTLQVAKVTKLLLRMERGGDGLTAGETLDSIDVEDEDKDCAKESDAESETDTDTEDEAEQFADDESDNDGKQKKGLKRAQTADQNEPDKRLKLDVGNKRKVQKRTWEDHEKDAVYKHLQRYIVSEKVPGRKVIDECLAAESLALKKRTWTNVKDFIRNTIKANQKA